jgi:hypothetical protein
VALTEAGWTDAHPQHSHATSEATVDAVVHRSTLTCRSDVLGGAVRLVRGAGPSPPPTPGPSTTLLSGSGLAPLLLLLLPPAMLSFAIVAPSLAAR